MTSRNRHYARGALAFFTFFLFLITPQAIGGPGGSGGGVLALRGIVFPTLSARFVVTRREAAAARTPATSSSKDGEGLLRGELLLAENLESGLDVELRAVGGGLQIAADYDSSPTASASWSTFAKIRAPARQGPNAGTGGTPAREPTVGRRPGIPIAVKHFDTGRLVIEITAQ